MTTSRSRETIRKRRPNPLDDEGDNHETVNDDGELDMPPKLKKKCTEAIAKKE